MKTTAMMMMALAAVSAAKVRTGPADAAPKHTMTAYVTDHRADSRGLLRPSEEMASQMFAAAGLRLEWRLGAPPIAPSRADMVFVIDITDRTPPQHMPGAMAFASLFEGVHLTVFYDRVLSAPVHLPDLMLAHVLVHEITHLLQGIARHSETGVMKAQYDHGDAYQMVSHPLPFTKYDLILIDLGIAGRLGTPLVAANATADAAAAYPR